MDWGDINTYGSLASLGGIIISFLAFIAADKAKKVAKQIQDGFIFDKRIPQHLKVLDGLLSEYNEFLSDIDKNQSEIRTLLAKIKSELANLSEKIKTEEESELITSTVSKINKKSPRQFYKESESHLIHLKLKDFFKGFYLTSHKEIWNIYTSLNEIHWCVNNLKLDRKYIIK